MVVWLLGSPFLTVSRLPPFTFQPNDKLPYPPFIPLLTLSSPSKHHPNTLNLVSGIMEEANNESKWWVLEIRGRGMSSDPQKILSNNTGTLKGWQWSSLLFSVLHYCWGKIREFLSIAKKGKKGERCFWTIQTSNSNTPPVDYGLCVLKRGRNKAVLC